MAITGHSGGNGDMSRRYDQVDDADLLKAVEKKNPVRGGVLNSTSLVISLLTFFSINL
jgi:hypothetical protein